MPILLWLLVTIFASGCAMHQRVMPVIVLDEALSDGKDFVKSVDARMPDWDKDKDFAQYERREIATVKADVAVAYAVPTKMEFMKAVAKLHSDWDALIELDQRLSREFWM